MADTQELLKRLEQGVQEVMSTEGWRRYLTAQAKFHNYSAGNVLLILSQKPEATQVAGFNTWREMGRAVKKGEHSIQILAPIFPKRGSEESREASEVAKQLAPVGGASQEEAATAARSGPVRYRVAHVFDVSQTDGERLPAPPVHRLEGDSGEARLLLGRLTLMAAEEGLHIGYAEPREMPGRALGYYQPDTRRIVLAKGLAPDQQAKTLAHELAHHMLEHGRGREPGRPTQEAEAEGVAFVVCQKFGVDTSQYSFGYVAGWSKDDGGIALVREASTAIQKVARDIIDRIEPQQVRAPEFAVQPARQPAMAAGLDR